MGASKKQEPLAWDSNPEPSQPKTHTHTSLAQTVKEQGPSSHNKAGSEGWPEATNLKGIRVIRAPQGPSLKCQGLGVKRREMPVYATVAYPGREGITTGSPSLSTSLGNFPADPQICVSRVGGEGSAPLASSPLSLPLFCRGLPHGTRRRLRLHFGHLVMQGSWWVRSKFGGGPVGEEISFLVQSTTLGEKERGGIEAMLEALKKARRRLLRREKGRKESWGHWECPTGGNKNPPSLQTPAKLLRS